MTLTIACYHAIEHAESDFERGLGVVTHPRTFKAHLAYFEKNYDIVSLQDVLDGKLPRRSLLLTFDDFYKSSVEVARDILRPRGLPSVFFVNPAYVACVGADPISLDNLIAYYCNIHSTPALCVAAGFSNLHTAPTTVADVIQRHVSPLTMRQRGDLRERLVDRFGRPETAWRAPIVEAADLRRCADYGVEVANHTTTHGFCRSLAPDEIDCEIVRAKEDIEVMTGRPVRAFAMPYGHEDDLTADVRRTLHNSGHEAIFLVHGRSNRWRPAYDVWYRTSFNGQSLKSLPRELETKPLLRGAKAALKRHFAAFGRRRHPPGFVNPDITPAERRMAIRLHDGP